MIAEFNVDGMLHRFRVSLLSRKGVITPMDYELTDISENPTDKYNGVRIDHYKFKDAVRTNKIKLII
jgi:hypothetical protein